MLYPASITAFIHAIHLDLLEDSSSKCKFCYLDDVVVVRVGKTPSEAVETVQEEVDRIIQLASTHMVNFDPSESGLLDIGGGL